VPPEPYLVLSAPKGASASPVAGAVQPRVTKLPEKLRSNRYLWLEFKQIGHDCAATAAGLDRNFGSQAIYGVLLRSGCGVQRSTNENTVSLGLARQESVRLLEGTLTLDRRPAPASA